MRIGGARCAPPPSQTGRADLPHPALQSVGALSRRSRLFARSPRMPVRPSVPPPVSPRGHSRWFVFRHSVLHPSTFLRSLRSTVVTRFFATTDALTPAVAALRPAGGMNTVFGPPPVSLIISLGLPAIPSPTINARPASRGCSAIRLGGLSPCRRLRPSLEGSPRRADRIEFTVSSDQGGRLLRTGRSRSIALHLALPRRSYGSIPHGAPPRASGLPPLQPSAFSGALRTSRCDVPAR